MFLVGGLKKSSKFSFCLKISKLAVPAFLWEPGWTHGKAVSPIGEYSCGGFQNSCDDNGSGI